MTESVTLSGDALVGIAPSHLYAAGQLLSLPRSVKLGRIRPKSRPQALSLKSYMHDKFLTGGGPPPTVDWYTKAKASIGRMYKNDQFGCCVISGKAHNVGVWTANQTGTAVLVDDATIVDTYHKWCGPGDNGCNITEVLNLMKSKGFPMGDGRVHKIDGYVSIDWTNQLEVMVAEYLFGASTIGINLPEAWTQSAVWDVTNTQIVGGHDVSPVGYDDKGVYVSSWGRIYLITWRAFQSTKWLEEMYAMLAPDWYASANNTAPNMIDLATLQVDLQKLGGGTIPSIDPPQPPVPPQPPQPPTPPGPGPGPGPHKGSSLITVNWETGVIQIHPNR